MSHSWTPWSTHVTSRAWTVFLQQLGMRQLLVQYQTVPVIRTLWRTNKIQQYHFNQSSYDFADMTLTVYGNQLEMGGGVKKLILPLYKFIMSGRGEGGMNRYLGSYWQKRLKRLSFQMEIKKLNNKTTSRYLLRWSNQERDGRDMQYTWERKEYQNSVANSSGKKHRMTHTKKKSIVCEMNFKTVSESYRCLETHLLG